MKKGYKSYYDSPMGKITLYSDGESLNAVKFEKFRHCQMDLIDIEENDSLEIFKQTKVWFDKYYNGEKPLISDLKLDPLGTDFRYQVWDELIKIPYGEVVTYGDIARTIAKKNNKKSMSAQAVGGAVGHNPISVIIPCHRVIGTSGSLTGFGGGISNKIKLLEYEGVDMSEMTIPTKGTAL